MIDPDSVRVPGGEDILQYRDRYDQINDLEALERVVKVMLDVMTGAQRLAILNGLRGRESRDDDWPYYVATEPEGS